MTALPAYEIEADGAGFRPLAPQTMADGLLGILRHQAFMSFGVQF
jgi:hypothetical protein